MLGLGRVPEPRHRQLRSHPDASSAAQPCDEQEMRNLGHLSRHEVPGTEKPLNLL